MDLGRDLLVRLVLKYEILDGWRQDLDMGSLVKEKLGDIVILVGHMGLWSDIYYKQKYNWKWLGLNRLGGMFGKYVGNQQGIVWKI